MVDSSLEGAADSPVGTGVESVLDTVRLRARAARKEVKQAREALDRAEAAKSFWDALAGHISRNEFGSIVLHLDRNRGYARRLREEGDPIASVLDSLQNEAQGRATQSAKTLGRTLPEAARQAGLGIDLSSRHPKYTFSNGFIRLELNDKRLSAKISIREGDERGYGLDVDLLVNVLKEETTRLFSRDFNPEPFLRSLHTAYSAVLRSEDLGEGTEVPIRKVMHRLAKNLNRFRADEFNVDLATAIQQGRTTIDGLTLHLNHTRNTRQGMLLHGLEQGGYVGFVSFKTEEKQ